MPLEFMDMLAQPNLGFSQALLSNANPESVGNHDWLRASRPASGHRFLHR